MLKHRDAAPNIISANAILITRYKVFLRRVLFLAKSTIVSAFPTKIKTACAVKALCQAMTSALAGSSSVNDKEESFFLSARRVARCWK